ETEEKSYYMEQQDLLPGLREGLKLMKRGEKMTFIFPSQLAYGFYGDNDKIGPDTPLIYEVSVLKIIQN
ncbi:MAG: gliding motility-associated peptidyl-prolyl isomerase GldI, partial [Flavobacteriaceae bacterium]|nr:gliding motility-associated peptidyl-prolyl isomerase GldI [Flavobacteriaceae bacterium]